jgi:hypothetical protein
MVPAGHAPAPFEIVGKVFDEVDDWSPQQLLSRFPGVLSNRRTELLAADKGLFIGWLVTSTRSDRNTAPNGSRRRSTVSTVTKSQAKRVEACRENGYRVHEKSLVSNAPGRGSPEAALIAVAIIV